MRIGGRVTRLGAGVDADRHLTSEAMTRTEAAVAEFRAIAAECGATRVLLGATSAVRDSANGPEFVRLLALRHGIDVRILTGEEEADTVFRGVLSGGLALDGTVVVIDVGGGSTEFVWGQKRRLLDAVSVDAGAVRTTERWLGEDRISPTSVGAATASITALFEGLGSSYRQVASKGIAVAGTATTIAALHAGLAKYEPQRVHGSTLTRQVVRDWQDRLAAMTLAERRGLAAMDPARAPVITGGAVVLGCALDYLALDAVTISRRDIVHGIAILAAS